MSFRRLAFFVLSVLIQGCSFQNEFHPNIVRFEGNGEILDTKSFVAASKYDRACLTYRGAGGIQRTRWVEIEKSGTLLSAEFQIPNLLGGYNYEFNLFGIDTDSPATPPIGELCPNRLPKASGWAQLGYRQINVNTKAKSIEVVIPFAFEEGDDDDDEADSVVPSPPINPPTPLENP
jgi:hypothetical protein